MNIIIIENQLVSIRGINFAVIYTVRSNWNRQVYKYLKILVPVMMLSGIVATITTTEVTEPGSLVLMAIGLLSLFWLRQLQFKPVRVRNRKRHK